MPDNEKYRQAYIATLQPHVQEPVRAILVLSRAGALGRLGTIKFSPLASAVMNRASKQATGGLPESVIVGVTDTALHVFAYKPRNTGIKVKEVLAIWPREGLQVTTERAKMTTQIRIAFPDGIVYPFETMNMAGDLNDPGLALLGAD